MFWFALVPGLALCVLVVGLLFCEWLGMPGAMNNSHDIACPICGAFKQHAFAEDPE